MKLEYTIATSALISILFSFFAAFALHILNLIYILGNANYILLLIIACFIVPLIKKLLYILNISSRKFIIYISLIFSSLISIPIVILIVVILIIGIGSGLIPLETALTIGDGVEEGRLGHIIPREFIEKDKKIAISRISRNNEKDLFEKLPPSRQREEYQIDVSSRMKVVMIPSPSDAFTVIPLSEDEQILPETGFAQWEWDVIAEKPGSHHLILRVSLVLIDKFGNKSHTTIPVYRQSVDVKVLPFYRRLVRFASQQWQWLFGIMLAIISLLIGYQQLEKRKSNKKNSENRE